MSARKFSRIASGGQRRYRPAEKAKFLRLADRIGVAKSVERTGVSPWSIYRWMRDRELARSARDPEGIRGLGHVQKPPRIQVPEAMQKQVLAVWRNNPGFGPSQIHNQLRRVGVRCDTKTIRKIIGAHGYTPPRMKPPRTKEDRRFEASRPLELVQMDVLQFHVHAQRLYLILALDDNSRFIVGWALLQRETMDDAIACLEEAIRRYGKPEAVLTDRGAVFHTWSGIGQFDRVLEAYGIDHLLSAPDHPYQRAKIERWFGTTRRAFLRRLDLPRLQDLDHLNRLLFAWVEGEYHVAVHRGLQGLSPLDAWIQRSDGIRSVPHDVNLDEVFLEETTRRIAKDGTFNLKGKVFEAGPLFIGQRLTVYFDPFDLRHVTIKDHQGKPLDVFPVDLSANRYVRRNPDSQPVQGKPVELNSLEDLAQRRTEDTETDTDKEDDHDEQYQPTA